jgi:hypothetical protein
MNSEMMMRSGMMKARGGSSIGARPQAMMRGGEEGGEGFSPARSALDDPNLANVAIVGLIYIFNKPPDPPPAPATTQPAAGTPAAPAESAATGAEPAEKTDSAGAADETPDDKSNEKPEDSADTKPDSPSDDDARPGKSD